MPSKNITTSCDLVFSEMQANDSQVEQPCKEETKEPEEEARARGLQVLHLDYRTC